MTKHLSSLLEWTDREGSHALPKTDAALEAASPLLSHSCAAFEADSDARVEATSGGDKRGERVVRFDYDLLVTSDISPTNLRSALRQIEEWWRVKAGAALYTAGLCGGQDSGEITLQR